jgi:hypothetical protein
MDTDHTFEELDEEITDLSVHDFHVFQDGVEQRIQSVSVEQPRVWDGQDNVSHHLEESFTPRGIWSSADLRPRAIRVRPFLLAVCISSPTLLRHRPKASAISSRSE